MVHDSTDVIVPLVAAITTSICLLATIAVHYCTPLLWPRYLRLPRKKQVDWCNRMVSAAHVRIVTLACNGSQTGERLPALKLTRLVGPRLLSWSATSFHLCATLSCWQTLCTQ